jgi:tetratricopeptide (TPR) repeat protein
MYVLEAREMTTTEGSADPESIAAVADYCASGAGDDVEGGPQRWLGDTNLSAADDCPPAGSIRFASQENPSTPLDSAIQLRKARVRWGEACSEIVADSATFAETADKLTSLGYLDEADILVSEAVGCLPISPTLLARHADMAERRRDWVEALSRWRRFVELFPGHPRGPCGAITALRELGRLDEAEAAYGLREHLEVDLEYAASGIALALTRRDWRCALSRCDNFRVRFPDHPFGYVVGATALRENGDINGAYALLQDAHAHGLDNVDLRLEEGWVLHAREEWDAAIAHWETFRDAYPCQPHGYISGAAALSRTLRQGEADSLLGTAVDLFPQDLEVGAAYASAADGRLDWATSAPRWRALAERHPLDILPVEGLSLALTRQGAFAEAEEQLQRALNRWPDEARLWHGLARVAEARGDAAEVVRRWMIVRDKWPTASTSYVALAQFLIRVGELDKAARELSLAPESTAPDLDLALAHARLASAMKDWANAVSQWSALAERWAAHSAGAAGLIAALRDSGNDLEADRIATEAMKTYHSCADIAVAYALNAERVENWPEAERRWRKAKMLHPRHEGIAHAHGNALWHAQLADPRTEPSRAGIASTADSRTALPTAREKHDAASMRELMLCFESLGDNCEFGSVQRRAGAEPLGLLRFAAIGPENLAKALDSKFFGFGDPRNTAVDVHHNGEYFLRDTRGLFAMHTFVQADTVDRDRFLAKQQSKMSFLRTKLIDDLQEGRKIFVYKDSARRLRGDDMIFLHRHLNDYGPGWILFVVESQGDAAPATVDLIGDRVMVGYIDRFASSASLTDISYNIWFDICRRAAEIKEMAQPTIRIEGWR